VKWPSLTTWQIPLLPLPLLHYFSSEEKRPRHRSTKPLESKRGKTNVEGKRKEEYWLWGMKNVFHPNLFCWAAS
jgi:hypothetical protein